jgi:hypothetical protein
MPGRAARFACITLLILGLALLLWLPISFKVWVTTSPPWPRGFIVASFSGTLGISAIESQHRHLYPPKLEFSVFPRDTQLYLTPEALRPRVWKGEYVPNWANGVTVRTTTIFVPIWLLSFLCLTWPVSSFVIARRRGKRGFPIEPSGAPLPH